MIFFEQPADRTYHRWQKRAFKSMKYCALIAILLIAASQIGCLPGSALSTADKLADDKDYYGAIEAYQNIIDTQPGTPDALKAQFAIGKLSIDQMNKPAEGIKAYEGVIAAAPESEEAAEAHYELGLHYYREKDFKSAQTQFDAIVNNFSHLELSHNAHLMLARSYEGDADYESAVEAFDNFANRNPRNKRAAPALEHKARIQRQFLKNEEEAKRTNQMLVKRYGKVEGAEDAVRKQNRNSKTSTLLSQNPMTHWQRKKGEHWRSLKHDVNGIDRAVVSKEVQQWEMLTASQSETLDSGSAQRMLCRTLADRVASQVTIREVIKTLNL